VAVVRIRDPLDGPWDTTCVRFGRHSPSPESIVSYLGLAALDLRSYTCQHTVDYSARWASIYLEYSSIKLLRDDYPTIKATLSVLSLFWILS
jgi:hypothetical protein